MHFLKTVVAPVLGVCLLVSALSSCALHTYFLQCMPQVPRPDLNRTCPHVVNGWTVYLTPGEARLDRLAMWAGLVSGGLLVAVFVVTRSGPFRTWGRPRRTERGRPGDTGNSGGGSGGA